MNQAKQVRVNVNVPASIHRQFKALLAERGLTINGTIQKWISDTLKAQARA